MELKGIAASPGITEGKAYLYMNPDLTFARGNTDDVAAEMERLRAAVGKSLNELAQLKESVRARLGDDFAHIFRSQQTIAEDDSILGEVEELIRDERANSETALERVFKGYISLFSELDDSDYNKARGADIEDVFKRILRNLLNIPDMNLSAMPAGSIVVARELFPSDTALMDTEKVAGLVTEVGGATSHVAILANNLGIPAAVGVKDATELIQDRDIIVMDASDSEAATLYINPTEAVLPDIFRKKAALDAHRGRVVAEIGKPSVTSDGRAIRLSANVGSTAELKPAADAGAGSIGLYRTEFLFMNSPTLPTEEEQYRAYRAAAESFGDEFVIIRTLDIGGDKNLPALPMPDEDNPSLGNRALRLTLSRPELFLTQLRAILRAGAHGNLKVMFPMVSGVKDLDAALEFLDEARSELEQRGEPYDKSMETGIMVEIPSAVWSAEALARRVSFFSIGTNDLTQYLLAADRLNSDVSDYYRIFDPSVFRSIRQVVDAAESHDCWVGVCGELAGNPLAIPLLVGLGITELSMSPRALAEASWLIRNTSWDEVKNLAKRVLEMDTDDEIRALLRENYNSKEQLIL